MRKKFILSLVFVVLIVFTFSGCKNDVNFTYFNGIAKDGSYNTDMFYRNDLLVNHAADPSVIWVSKEEGGEVYGDYFYMYVTGTDFPVLKSKDLNNWEKVGTALVRTDNSWCQYGYFWAPEVIYNKADSKYYLYFSALASKGTLGNNSDSALERLFLSVAVSDTPVGPFILFNGTNEYGEVLDETKPNIDFKNPHGTVGEENYYPGKDFNFPGIDASPFFSSDGEMYLYFVAHNSSSILGNNIYGVRMFNPWTPDYSTLKQITQIGKESVGGDDFAMESGSNVNEAPFMMERNGLYYMTYAPVGYGSRLYSVTAAVANSPLGDFKKIKPENGNPIIGIEPQMDHMGGTGHHCFVQVENDLFVVYHAHMNRATGQGNPRGIAFDKVYWIDGSQLNIKASDYNLEGETFDMLYGNGPTSSIQPLATKVSGYENIAYKANITATNSINDTLKYLKDGLFVTHSYADNLEFISSGDTIITLNFDTPQEIRAIMIYNSYKYDYAFKSIDSIEFDLASTPLSYNGKGLKNIIIKDLPFNMNYVQKDLIMQPGSSAIAEFDTLKVNKITIKISKKLNVSNETSEIRISDIVVLGKAS